MIDTAHEQRIEQWSRYYASIGATREPRYHRRGEAKQIIGPSGKVYRSVREAATCCRVSECRMRAKLNDPGSGWKFDQEQST